MNTETFTDRYVDWKTVKRIEPGAVTGTDGWTAGAPDSVLALLNVGDDYGVETKGSSFGRICGFNIRGQWFARKSDQQLERERQQYRDDMARRDRERLAEYRAEWIGRTENLPGWLQERIQTFRERGGEKFELEGWGYELAVCELAALYDTSGGEDDATINAYAEQHGTSGNQHDCAKALARRHQAGGSLAGTIAALSPITGNAFYEPVSESPEENR